MATITQNTYTGDGTTTTFVISFPYISVLDVKIQIDGVALSASDYIFAATDVIELTTAPEVGAYIYIYRQTNVDTLPATFFPGSSIRAEDLNTDLTHVLYVSQEGQRQNDSSSGDAQTAIAIANQAKDEAEQSIVVSNAASVKADQALSDSAGAAGSAATAEAQANAASASANSAASDAQTALAQVADAEAAAAAAQQAAEEAADAVEDAVIDGGVLTVNGQSGIVSLSLTSLTDVETSSADHIPTDGQSLVWNESMGHWMPSDASLIIGSLPTLP